MKEYYVVANVNANEHMQCVGVKKKKITSVKGRHMGRVSLKFDRLIDECEFNEKKVRVGSRAVWVLAKDQMEKSSCGIVVGDALNHFHCVFARIIFSAERSLFSELANLLDAAYAWWSSHKIQQCSEGIALGCRNPLSLWLSMNTQAYDIARCKSNFHECWMRVWTRRPC